MADYSRLAAHWYRWAPWMGSGQAVVTTDCDDCDVLFSTDDFSVHLSHEDSWWVVDTVNDRGRRRREARLSNFDLTEKFLIWDWATTARSSLASGPLGADLASRGYAPGVKVSPADRGYEICLNGDCAILSVVNATIFSHLMAKSVEEIERMVTAGLE